MSRIDFSSIVIKAIHYGRPHISCREMYGCDQFIKAPGRKGYIIPGIRLSTFCNTMMYSVPVIYSADKFRTKYDDESMRQDFEHRISSASFLPAKARKPIISMLRERFPTQTYYPLPGAIHYLNDHWQEWSDLVRDRIIVSPVSVLDEVREAARLIRLDYPDDVTSQTILSDIMSTPSSGIIDFFYIELAPEGYTSVMTDCYLWHVTPKTVCFINTYDDGFAKFSMCEHTDDIDDEKYDVKVDGAPFKDIPLDKNLDYLFLLLALMRRQEEYLTFSKTITTGQLIAFSGMNRIFSDLPIPIHYYG